MKPFGELLREAVAFHGHLCPGQVLGVRMAMAGCRALGVAEPKGMGKNLVVFVEIDRCATDAIQAVTGCSLGKRTLKHVDYGKMAATFVNVATGEAVRVAARDDARERASGYAPGVSDPREAQVVAYGVMPEPELLRLTPVLIQPGWLDRRRVRVPCSLCGEGVNYGREVVSDGLTLCRSCAAGAYYVPRTDTQGAIGTSVAPPGALVHSAQRSDP
ncbi:MAG: TraR/DksA C4-type zinc finger protein [Candidatus Rokubacteria bacterium]|nr:TraR/DksA C4-type zinc finger protein [Candidatus Rokubacteria bacterium]